MSSTLESLIDAIAPLRQPAYREYDARRRDPYAEAPGQFVDLLAGNEKIERPFAAPAAV